MTDNGGKGRVLTRFRSHLKNRHKQAKKITENLWFFLVRVQIHIQMVFYEKNKYQYVSSIIFVCKIRDSNSNCTGRYENGDDLHMVAWYSSSIESVVRVQLALKTENAEILVTYIDSEGKHPFIPLFHKVYICTFLRSVTFRCHQSTPPCDLDPVSSGHLPGTWGFTNTSC